MKIKRIEKINQNLITMKNLLTACFVFLFTISMISQSAIDLVSHEVVYDSNTAISDGLTGYPELSKTYRIYAHLNNGTAVMQSVLAIPGVSELSIGTNNGNIYNLGSGFNAATLGEHVNEAFFPLVDPLTMYDSYVTIGTESNTNPAGASAVAAFSGFVGVDYNIDPAIFWGTNTYNNPDNPEWVANNDGWLLFDVAGPNAYGIGPDYKVLLAQITTTGDLAYKLNLTAMTDLPINNGVTHAYYWDESVVGVGVFDNEIDGSGIGLIYPWFNCDDPSACNYNTLPTQETNNETCDYSCIGCTDETSCNFNSFATIDDGSCEGISGCTLDTADNYNPDATCDNGTCATYGCLDANASNYNELATADDGSCEYEGCTNIESCNYNPFASMDDGSCEGISGCISSEADNYNPDATCDDGSCVIGGCTDPEASNYNDQASSDNGSCEYPGCTNSEFCNYDPNANIDDGSCSNAAGCTAPSADNYDPVAICDDGTCEFGNAIAAVTHEVVYDYQEALDEGLLDYPDGYQTYRIHAHMSNPTAVMQAVIGIPESSELRIGTDNGVVYNYNSPIGFGAGERGEDILEPFLGFFSPVAMWDSYYTIGTTSNINPVGFATTSNVVGEAGIDYNIPADEFWGNSTYHDPNNNLWIANNSGWVLTDVSAPNAYGIGPDLKVVLAQITTSGDLRYNLNLTALTDIPLNGGQQEYYFWESDAVGTLDEEYVQIDGSQMGLIYPASNCNDPAACNYNESPDLEGSIEACTYYCYGCMEEEFCNYDAFAIYEDGSCEGTIGCNNSEASNYDPEADCINESVLCVFAGCTDTNAVNFDFTATEDDGSCEYGIYGTVFLDSNENGQNEIGEPGIENWTIDIPALNICTFTSDGGEFVFSGIPAGTYELIISWNENWTNTTSQTVNVTFNGVTSESTQFGLSPANDDYSFFNFQECCIFLPWIHCDTGFFPGVWFHNEGTTNLNGTISITWNPLLEAEPQLGSVTPDILSDGYCEWQLNNYTPGSSDIFRIHILGPGFEYIGQNFDFDISFDFQDFNGEENFNSGIVLQPEVVCAYDPNDKYAEPEGYEEPHFVLVEDEIQYRVRFQNTGNFPAGEVIVRDTLSPHLDFNSFEPQFASHDMNTTFNTETGAIEFAFYDINLPDSTANEEESHGFLVYNIKPKLDLEAGTLIENTAHIYFDNNPAVVTNTTWHTIYDCNPAFAEFEASTGPICLNSAFEASTDTEYIENYLWEINGAVQPDVTDDMIYTPTFAQEYEVVFTASNPICEQTSSQSFLAVNGPTASIEGDEEICEGETAILTGAGANNFNWGEYGNEETIMIEGEEDVTIVLEVMDENGCTDQSTFDLFVNPIPEAEFSEDQSVLTASEGQAFQWYLENEIIEGATQQVYEASEDGNYSVEIWNEEGCSSISQESFVSAIGIYELNDQLADLSPNPITTSGKLLFENLGTHRVKLYNYEGKLIRNYGLIHAKKLLILREDLAPGNYFVSIDTNEKRQRINFIILD